MADTTPAELVAAVGDHRGRREVQVEEEHALRRRISRLAQAGLDRALKAPFEAETAEPFGEVHPRQSAVIDERIDLRSGICHGREPILTA